MLLFFFLYLVFMYQYGRLIFCQVISYLRNNFIFLFFISSLRNLIAFSVICRFFIRLFENIFKIIFVPKRTGPNGAIYPKRTGPNGAFTSPQLHHLLYHHQPTKSPYLILLLHLLKLYSLQSTYH